MTSIRKQKIAFVRMGPFPYANENMARLFENIWPEYELEIIDVVEWVKYRKALIFVNILFMLKEYGLQLLLGRRRAWNCFFTTTYIFKQIKLMVNRHLTAGQYVFSFQMQSLFDASTFGLPHFVYTDHTYLANLEYRDFDRRSLPTQHWLELEKTIYHNATLNFVRSTNIAHSLKTQYGCDPEQVICVYAGSNARVEDAVLDNDTYGNKHILFVGMDWERKGGPELVEAFKAVLEVHPDAHLTVVGCTPQLDLPNCRALGQVPLQQVHTYYKTASIFCLPTRLEPFGIVLIEALHYKLPIVATNVGAIPDLVENGKNGYLVSPYNKDHLAQALINLLGDPQQCQRFGSRGYAMALERYNWRAVGTAVREQIDKAIQVNA